MILSGDDAILQSETGSGKTLAFVLPALAVLDYPPTVYTEDLKVGGLPPLPLPISSSLGHNGGVHEGAVHKSMWLPAAKGNP